MKKRISITNTDLSMSPIGLGTVGAGLSWDGADADRVIDTYISMGGNVIDSARIYSDWVPPETGRSERVIGDWIQREGRRNEVIIMTKGGHPKHTSPADDIHIPRMTAADMRYDLELSLRALHVDAIDIYFYHRDDRNQNVEDEIEVMETFRKEGKIRYYGCSNWEASRIKEADHYCGRMGYRGFAADQALLNFGMKHMKPLEDDTLVYLKDSLYQYHQEHLSNAAMPYMGAAGGFFHLYIEKGADFVSNSPYYTPGNIRAAERVKMLMEKYNATISQVLLGFFSCQEFPCIPLYGPEHAAHVEDAMKSLDIIFSMEDFN